VKPTHLHNITRNVVLRVVYGSARVWSCDRKQQLLHCSHVGLGWALCSRTTWRCLTASSMRAAWLVLLLS
jgi:hypothetical protein